MSALEQLRKRYERSGHPFSLAATLVASGGTDEGAQRVLDELDAPRVSTINAWQATDTRSEPKT